MYFRARSASVNKLHKQIGPDYIDRKIRPAMNASLKNVIPQYSALELNNTYRKDAENSLVSSLKERFPKFFVDLIGVELTKVDIPKRISDQIVEKQVQDERNALAEKKKLEEENLAKARIAKAQGNYKASEFDKKTKENMSSTKLLELYRAETERVWAEKGVSQYGSNNVFGSSDFLKIKNNNMKAFLAFILIFIAVVVVWRLIVYDIDRRKRKKDKK